MAEVLTLNEFATELSLSWDGLIPADIEHAGNLTAARPYEKVKTEQGGDQYRPSPEGAVQRDYGRGILLWLLAQRYQPSAALEIGFGRGFGTYCLVKAAKQFGGIVVSIDQLDFDVKFRGCVYPDGDKKLVTTRRKVITDLLRSSDLREQEDKLVLRTGTSESILPNLSDGSYQLVFVDGAHHREGVEFDIGEAQRICPHGIVVFHDYRCPVTKGVTQALDAHVSELEDRYTLFQVVTDGWIDDQTYRVFSGIDSCILVCVAK